MHEGYEPGDTVAILMPQFFASSASYTEDNDQASKSRRKIAEQAIASAWDSEVERQSVREMLTRGAMGCPKDVDSGCHATASAKKRDSA